MTSGWEPRKSGLLCLRAYDCVNFELTESVVVWAEATPFAEKKMHSRTPGRSLSAIVFVLASLMPAAAACVPAEGEVVPLEQYRRRLERLEDRSFAQTIEIVDRSGRMLADYAPDGHRIWLAFDEIPKNVRIAVVATEDRTFYSNAGVDKKAVARAMLQNAQAGDNVSGASTITMQLVRLVAFEGEERYAASLDRKIREVHLAAELDERYTKDEILEFYLNVAYFGRGAYGIESAAHRFFDVSASGLSPGQAVFLSGLLQAPSALDPDRNLAGARERQRIVLDRMISVGVLSEEQARVSFEEPLNLIAAPILPERRAEHFVDHVVRSIPDLIGEDAAARGGYRVETTLDVELNERIAGIAARHVASLRVSNDVGDAAVVSVEPSTGQILAMIGGVDYDREGDGQVNVATSRRQSGSAFKPIAYAAAMEQGWSPGSILWDVPLEFPDGRGGQYVPRNYDGKYRGPVRLRYALANSLNAASIGLLAESGVESAHATALNLGIPLDPDPWRYGLSLALGGAEVPLLDLTAAYGAFANGGELAGAHAITRIERLADGSTLYVHEDERRRVLSPQTSWLMADMLDDDNVRRPAFGTGGPLELPEPAAVKTGTTNDFHDNLTIGFTPWMVVGVWAGNKDGRPMRDVLGVTGAAPIWHDVMGLMIDDSTLRASLLNGELSAFQKPARIIERDVCDIATLRVTGECNAVQESFDRGTANDDRLIAFDWFLSRPTGNGRCDARSESGRGSVRLLAPRTEHVIAAARRWSSTHGIALAGRPCDGPSDGNSPRLERVAADVSADVPNERLH